jgi:hypothetical protein
MILDASLGHLTENVAVEVGFRVVHVETVGQVEHLRSKFHPLSFTQLE